MRHVIALDVGGTGMKAALVAADGTLLHEDRRPTGRERGPDAVVAAILDFAADLGAHGEREYGEPAVAAGVAVPGIVDADTGVASYSANLGWRDVPLRDLLSRRLDGIPVALGHDVRSGGLAEAGDTLVGPRGTAVEERITFQKLPPIVPAALGDTAGCL
ncbi:MAG: ROK family protein, partial [Streptomyces sp.]|nr:ROK family protein [Streptomyces sp.]